MLRAVIFDFDGVIVDSEMTHFESFNKALKPYKVQISKEQYFEEYLGLTDSDLLRTLVEEGRLKINESQVETITRKKTEIFEETAKQAPIIDGVSEFLELLEQNNITAAICSGALSAEIEMILNNANLRRFFKVIVSAEQAAKGKPAPDGFLVTLEKLNEKTDKPIKANQCVVIEDSRWGLEAAETAGMHTVAVTNSYGADELSLAEIVVGSLSELKIDVLRGLCK
jgi:phosphoglycolate phosphatase